MPAGLIDHVIQAARLLASLITIVAVLIVIHSGMKLSDTQHESGGSRPKVTLGGLLGFSTVIAFSRRRQPPEKWKYIDRFAYSLAVFLLGMAALAFLQGYGGAPK